MTAIALSKAKAIAILKFNQQEKGDRPSNSTIQAILAIALIHQRRALIP